MFVYELFVLLLLYFSITIIIQSLLYPFLGGVKKIMMITRYARTYIIPTCLLFVLILYFGVGGSGSGCIPN